MEVSMASALQKIAMNHFLTILSDTPVTEAVKRMKLGGDDAIAVNENGRLVGIFREHDLLEKVVGLGLNPAEVTVKQVMLAMPTTVPESISIDEALRTLRDERTTHLVLLDPLDQVVGIISEKEILEIEVDKLLSDNKDLTCYIMADAPGG